MKRRDRTRAGFGAGTGRGGAAALLVAAVLALASGTAPARQLLQDGAMTVHVADLGFCEETVAVEVRGPASAFAGDRFALYRAVAVLTAILPVECPQARAMRVLGVADGRPVWQGRASLPDGSVTELPLPGAEDRIPLDRRAMVSEIQEALNARGYDAGPVDGLMGPSTRSAIRAYQADAGRPVDGAADPGLVRALRAAPAAPPSVAAAPERADPEGADAPPVPDPGASAKPVPGQAAEAEIPPPAKPAAPAAAETEPAPPLARLLAPLEFQGRTVEPGLLRRPVLGELWDLPVALGGNAAEGVELTLPDGSVRSVTTCDGWFSARESGGDPATTFDRSMAGFFHRTCDPVVALGNAPTLAADRLAAAEAPPLDLAAWSPVLAPDLSGEADGKLAAFADAGRSLADIAEPGSVEVDGGAVAFTWRGLRRSLEPVALAQMDEDPALEALVFVADHALDGTYRAYAMLSVDRDPETGQYRPD